VCVCVSRSDVKERVVWVDTKKTQVKNKAGKLKEKEITILEVRLEEDRCQLEQTEGRSRKERTTHARFLLVGESESPEARRQAAPGDPVQHRGPH